MDEKNIYIIILVAIVLIVLAIVALMPPAYEQCRNATAQQMLGARITFNETKWPSVDIYEIKQINGTAVVCKTTRTVYKA